MASEKGGAALVASEKFIAYLRGDHCRMYGVALADAWEAADRLEALERKVASVERDREITLNANEDLRDEIASLKLDLEELEDADG